MHSIASDRHLSRSTSASRVINSCDEASESAISDRKIQRVRNFMSLSFPPSNHVSTSFSISVNTRSNSKMGTNTGAMAQAFYLNQHPRNEFIFN
jgi:hypothetical protein